MVFVVVTRTWSIISLGFPCKIFVYHVYVVHGLCLYVDFILLPVDMLLMVIQIVSKFEYEI